MPSLSVIIPTHNRAHTLKLCLQCLSHQTIADELEVIVVNDIPDPETANLFRNTTNYKLQTTNYQLPATSYFEIPKTHQGVARNFGVKHAHSPYVLFIGDDILLDPTACEKHLQTHVHMLRGQSPLAPTGGKGAGERGISTAVLGHVTWDPTCEITPVMRFLERSGWQFGYPRIEKFAHRFLPKKIQQRFTYTSHVSLPTDIARKFTFREDVSLYGWEDIEWGDRLKEAGVRLFYEPGATALHHHHITLEQSLARMETLGKSLVHMAKIVPEWKEKLARWRWMLQCVRSIAPNMSGKHRRAFLRGIRSARGTSDAK